MGIVWVVGGRLVIDATPVNKAEEYGDFRIHPRDYCTTWGMLQRAGTVPYEMEYEELPRGRVMYNTKTHQFTLLTDRCILSKKALVRNIRSQMRLPKDTKTSTDEHYRCFRCLKQAKAGTRSCSDATPRGRALLVDVDNRIYHSRSAYPR